MSRADDPKQIEYNERVLQYQQTRSPSLLEEIIKEHQPYVRIIVNRIAGGSVSILDADDLLQSGLMGLMSAIGRYDGSIGVPFRSWAYKRIRGAILDAIRSASSTARTRSVQFVALEDVYSSDEVTAYEEHGLSKDASGTIRSVMSGLPLRNALVMLLAINGLPTSQIALVMDISVSQVQQDRHHTMVYLKEKLIDLMGELV